MSNRTTHKLRRWIPVTASFDNGHVKWAHLNDAARAEIRSEYPTLTDDRLAAEVWLHRCECGGLS